MNAGPLPGAEAMIALVEELASLFLERPDEMRAVLAQHLAPAFGSLLEYMEFVADCGRRLP